jgi:hypothetical protein
MRKTTRKTSGERTCPDCGATVPGAILLCDCGYHFQTQRVLKTSDDGASTSSASTDASSDEQHEWRGGAPSDEQREQEGALRYPWLGRGAKLFVVLAYLSVLASAFRLYALVKAYVETDVPGGGQAAQGAFVDFLLAAFLVVLAGCWRSPETA